MTSGQDVSEYLDTLGLVRSYFSIFLREKKNVLLLRCSDAPEDQAICLFAGLLANPDMPLSHYIFLGFSFLFEDTKHINQRDYLNRNVHVISMSFQHGVPAAFELILFPEKKKHKKNHRNGEVQTKEINSFIPFLLNPGHRSV